MITQSDTTTTGYSQSTTGYSQSTGTNEVRFSDEEDVTIYLQCRDEYRHIDKITDERKGWFNPRKILIINRPKLKCITKNIRNTLPRKIRINETRRTQPASGLC